MLFDETFAQPNFFGSYELPRRSVVCVLLQCFNAQPYNFAVANCVDVALSVFYSPILTRCRIFFQL